MAAKVRCLQNPNHQSKFKKSPCASSLPTFLFGSLLPTSSNHLNKYKKVYMSPVSASFIPGITRSDDGNELLDTHRDTGTRRTIGGRPPGKPRSPLSIKSDREDIAWRSKNRKRKWVDSALSSRELRESMLRFDSMMKMWSNFKSMLILLSLLGSSRSWCDQPTDLSEVRRMMR
jgi:hypothetical protein